MQTLRVILGRGLRPLLLGALAGLAILAAVLALRTNQAGVGVWVTQQRIDLGGAVADGQPRLVMVPPQARPEGALESIGEVQQAEVARPVPARSILTEADLVGSERSRSLASGEVLLSVTVPARIGGDLQEGEIVDLWGHGSKCADLTCEPVLLSPEGEVRQVLKERGEKWAGEETVAVLLRLRQADIGQVLLAESDGSLSFVLQAVPAGNIIERNGKQS